MTDRTAAWTAVLHPADRTGSRLVAFHHAGSGAQRYRSLLAGLPGDTEVVGVTLPGRERRAAEAPGTSLSEAVAAIGAELDGLLPVPTVFYGHSMGALLAVATAHAGAGRCGALVVSCSVPGAAGYPHPLRLRSREGVAEVLALHGLSADALDDAGLDPARRALAHDLSLTREALLAVGAMRLTVPLTALAGTGDPLVDPGALPLWAGFTSGEFRARPAEGGHFFPFAPAGRRLLLGELTVSLRAVRGHPAGVTP